MQSGLHKAMKRARSTLTTLRSDPGMQPGPSKREVQIAMAGEPKKKKITGKTFSTFVFMDLETTGLIQIGNIPKITELCLVSAQREDLLDGTSTLRVLNKLVLCFNPKKSISTKATELTDLSSANLGRQPVFSENTTQLINSFLQHLSQPVCLLAHNGNRFDFPILKAELNEINQSLDTTLFCADTLEAFKTVDDYGPYAVPYNLEDIYFKTFDIPLQKSHRAEDDCIALLKITKEKGSDVLKWEQFGDYLESPSTSLDFPIYSLDSAAEIDYAWMNLTFNLSEKNYYRKKLLVWQSIFI